MKKLRLLFTFFMAITIAASGQERPKIGLVLSGGGAKGLAHVGVLNAIDSAGLNIDYITGTSMGAIIAAMYAAGYSGKQIEAIARDMNWGESMGGSAKYDMISIEKKDEFENYTIELPMEDGFKPKTSTGFVEPQEIMLKFSEVFFPVYKTKDFSKLKIPFKCIATDLGSGDAVVIDKGDLAFAVRSSMAIPGVFSATKYGSTKLVDGGIVRNFPVKDVLEMGADYVIGVNLFSGLTNAGDMTSMIDVVLQITNFRDAKDLVNEKRVCDMIIEPDVANYSAASFSSSDNIMAIGDSIGRDFYPLFKQLADSLHREYGVEYKAVERMDSYSPTVKIESFIIDGLEHTSEEMLLHHLNLKRGHSYTPQQLNEAFRRAYSSQSYANLYYELLPLGEEGNSVCLKCIVDELPLTVVKIAPSYNTFSNASIFLGYTMKNIFGSRTNTDFKIALSESFRLRFNNRIYFGQKYDKYFDAKYELTTYDLPHYQGKTRDCVYSYTHNNFSATIGRIFMPDTQINSSDAQLTLGYESYRLTPSVTGTSDIIDGRINNFYVNLRKRLNTTNRKFLPQKGVFSDINFYVGFKPRYNYSLVGSNDEGTAESFERKNIYRFTFEGKMFQPLTNRLTIFESMNIATSYGDKAFVHKTFLGGPDKFMPSHFTFFGLHTAQKYESSIAALGVGLQYRLVGELYTILRLNSALTFENIDTYLDNDIKFNVKDYLHGGGITVAYNFSHLPFSMTLMYSPDAKFNATVNVGFMF